MSLLKFAIRRPVAMTLFFSALFLFGLIAYFKLPMELFPNTDSRYITIWTSVRGGMPSDKVEQWVTQPIEEALSSVSNLTQIESISKWGRSIVVLTFSLETDINVAYLDVREKLSQIEENLPQEADKPILAKYRQSDLPVFVFALTSNIYSPEELRGIAQTQIKEELLRLSGVAHIEVYGGRDEKILVELKLERLNAAGISINQVTEVLSQNNLDVVLGDWKKGDQNLSVRGLGGLQHLSEMGELIVGGTKLNQFVRLKDLAHIKRGYLEKQSFSRRNRENAVTLYVQKESDANTLFVCQEIQKKIDSLKGPLGRELHFEIIQDQAHFIDKALRQMKSSLVLGALCATVILFLFIPSWRPLLLLMVSLPLSLLITFMALFLTGVSLNAMTLSGLALGVGLMVDGAILVIEKLMEQDPLVKNDLLMAERRVQELILPLVATTLTTLIVFIPLLYVSQEMKHLYSGLALSIAFSLLASLMVALLFIPTYFPLIKGKQQTTQRVFIQKGRQKYLRFLQVLLANRFHFLAIIILLFVAGIGLFGKLEKRWGELENPNQLTLFVELPSGTDLEKSSQTVSVIESFLLAFPEIESLSSRGEGGSSKINLTLIPEREREVSKEELISRLRPKCMALAKEKGAFIYFSGEEGGGFELRYRIYGEDLALLKKLAQKVGAVLDKIPNLSDVKMRTKSGRPELHLLIQRDKSALAGLLPNELANILHSQIRGVEATQLVQGDKEDKVIVRLQREDRDFIEKIKKFVFANKEGELIWLSQLVEFQESSSPSEIWHKGKRRVIEVSARLNKISVDQIFNLIHPQIKQIEIPSGVAIELGEEVYQVKRRFSQLFLALSFSVLLIYLLLASIFESFLEPLFVLLSIPFAGIGIAPLLLLVGKPITLGVLIGGILLVGLVVNHSILFMESYKQARSLGWGSDESIFEAGQKLFQPIMMTTLTTIMGLSPLAFLASESERLWSPLAITLIGGMISSTLLTLLVTPVLLKMVEDLKGNLTQ